MNLSCSTSAVTESFIYSDKVRTEFETSPSDMQENWKIDAKLQKREEYVLLILNRNESVEIIFTFVLSEVSSFQKRKYLFSEYFPGLINISYTEVYVSRSKKKNLSQQQPKHSSNQSVMGCKDYTHFRYFWSVA